MLFSLLFQSLASCYQRMQGNNRKLKNDRKSLNSLKQQLLLAEFNNNNYNNNINNYIDSL